MKLLAVETATSRQSVAVLDGATVLARADGDAGGTHAKHLMPAIDGLLRSTRLTLSDIQGLAVSIGPGSFTGLRVGLATMMGFRMVLGIPLAAVPTLEAMAWNLRDADQALCPTLKARAGEVYWALYRWRPDGTVACVRDERVGPLAMMAESLHEPVVMFGDGWLTYRQELRAFFRQRKLTMIDAPSGAMPVSAVSVGLAGLERLARGEAAGHRLSPRYVQRAEAEIMLERRTAALSAGGG